MGISKAASLGIKMITMRPGKFKFQGVAGVDFKGCKIAQTPFTNRMFKNLYDLEPMKLSKIVESPLERLEASLKVVHPDHKDESDNCPLVTITWKEAKEIAKLVGRRLPTELELERAASYIDGRIYPFGDQFNENLATFNTQGTRSVLLHQKGASPENVLDLCGNTWTWTSTPYGPIDFANPSNPILPKSGDYYVLRGGSWESDDLLYLQATYRNIAPAWVRNRSLGVRFAMNIFAGDN